MSLPADTVVLKRFPDELSALLLVGNLKSQGIPAVSVGGLTAQLRAEAPATVAVLVRAADLELAKEIVEELESPAEEDDDSGDDPDDESEWSIDDDEDLDDEPDGDRWGGLSSGWDEETPPSEGDAWDDEAHGGPREDDADPWSR